MCRVDRRGCAVQCGAVPRCLSVVRRLPFAEPGRRAAFPFGWRWALFSTSSDQRFAFVRQFEAPVQPVAHPRRSVFKSELDSGRHTAGGGRRRAPWRRCTHTHTAAAATLGQLRRPLLATQQTLQGLEHQHAL